MKFYFYKLIENCLQMRTYLGVEEVSYNNNRPTWFKFSKRYLYKKYKKKY